MPVAPGQWPRASGEDAVAVACFERPPGRRREGPTGVIELVLELALARDAADRRVAGVALDGLGRHRAAAVQLAGRCALGPGERVEAGADDQLRPGTGGVAPAARRPPPAAAHK